MTRNTALVVIELEFTLRYNAKVNKSNCCSLIFRKLLTYVDLLHLNQGVN